MPVWDCECSQLQARRAHCPRRRSPAAEESAERRACGVDPDLVAGEGRLAELRVHRPAGGVLDSGGFLCT